MNNVKLDTVIELQDDEAAIVVKNDGTVDLYFPEPENEDSMSTSSMILATAMGYLLVDKPDVVMSAIDHVVDEAHKMETDEELLEESEVLEEGDKDPECCGSKDCNCTHGEPV